MKRRIAVLTTSRADFGHLVWPLRALKDHPLVELKLIAMAAHLSHEFGATISEIEAAGFAVDEPLECLLSSDSDIGMAKTTGLATLGLADILGRLRPDLLLLIADRYEMLAPATVALALRIPIAHIEGGEVSEGAIDDAVRNALTKLSHVHLVPTKNAHARVAAMGEEPWRIHCTGAPSLDHLRHAGLPTRVDLAKELRAEFNTSTILVAFHPITLRRDTLEEADALFASLNTLALEHRVWFCFPNADAGSRQLIERARAFAQRHQSGDRQARVFVNLEATRYWALLREVNVLLGNSSSGIMETASVGLPTVNVGDRQKGRERARNVIDVEASHAAIVDGVERALSVEFRESLRDLQNPYGDGTAAEKICEVLTTVPLGAKLLNKRALGITHNGGWAPPV